MSKFKIRFQNPAGRQIEVDAHQKKASWSPSSVEGSYQDAKVGDGTVDVMVSEKRYVWDYNRHLGVDTSSLSSEDASALKRALEDPNAANLSVFDALSGRQLSDLQILRTDAAGELATVSPNLDTTGSRRSVQLTPSGHIATASGQEPQDLTEIGDGLFRAASLIDDTKGNLFDSIQAPLGLKEKMLDNLTQSVSEVRPGEPLPQGLDDTQALQMRSSAATTMLELMTAKNQSSHAFKAKAFDQYSQMLEQETNPLLKDSMVMNLDRLRGNLPSALRSRVDGLMETHAPTKPPYDEWFKDGDNTVKVDFSNGVGEGFLEDNVKYFEQQGFEKVGDTTSGHPILRKTYEKNGVETNVELHFRHNRSDMFKEVGDEDTDIVIYSGHASWGRNVRKALKNTEGATGKGKLVMTNLCVGKGELQQMRDKFPEAQFITTYNSEYFRQGGTAESHFAMDALFEGIAERRGYEHIAKETRETNPWQWDHEQEGIDNNFIFPTDLKLRRQLLDRDHDGQADVFDRMVNFNSFDVKTDTAREFQPIQPSRDTEELVGTKIHFAAMSTNRVSVYNGLLENLNGHAEVTPAGYHDAEATDKGLFHFERNDEGLVEMSMDAKYAHMSEEALRMASAFEYSMFKGDEGDRRWPLQGRTDNILHALVLASQSLNTDSGYRDSAIWDSFLEGYNLPDIPLSTVNTARGKNKHYYSGSEASVEYLRTQLSPEILAQLEQATTGIIQR